MASSAILLGVLALGPVLSGFRHPAAWSAAAAALWLGAHRARFGRPPGAGLWLAWAAWNLVSALASPEPLRSLGAAGEAASMVLVLAWASSLDAAGRRRLVAGLLSWAAPLAAAAFFASPSGYPMAGLLAPYYNYTAGFAAAAAAAGAATLLEAGPGRRRVLAAVAVLSGAAVLIGSGSRGGALAAFAGVVLAFRRAGRPRLVVAAGVAALAALALAPGDALRGLLKLDRPGANQRPGIWAAAAAVANDRPLLGTGPGRFEAGFQRRLVPAPEGLSIARYGLSTAYAHSEPLQAAAETGWPGLVLLLAAWWASAGAALRRKGEPEREAALAAAAAITVQALFDNLFALPWLRLVYAALLGACAPSRAKAEPLPELWRPALVAGLVLAAWGRWPGRLAERWLERADAAGTLEAAQLLDRASRLFPADARILESRARVALRSVPPDYAKARESVEGAYALSPYRAVYPQMLAELAASARDWETALGRAREASALEPNFLEARLVEAEALAKLGREEESREALRLLDEARERISSGPPPLSPYDRFIGFLDDRRLRQLR